MAGLENIKFKTDSNKNVSFFVVILSIQMYLNQALAITINNLRMKLNYKHIFILFAAFEKIQQVNIVLLVFFWKLLWFNFIDINDCDYSTDTKWNRKKIPILFKENRSLDRK